MDMTPRQYRNLARSLYYYVTTPTSPTFSILFGIQMYIVYNRWLCVWLFKFNHLMDITPTQYHNLVRSLYCYVTTPTSSTFSIYLGSIYVSIIGDFVCECSKFNHLKDITPVYHHNLARSLHCYIGAIRGKCNTLGTILF